MKAERQPGRVALFALVMATVGCGQAETVSPEPIDGGLVPERVMEHAFFGHSVAAKGDDIIVGAPGESDPVERSGAAYVFHANSDGTWDGGFRLSPPSAAQGCSFGWAVGISGDFAAVGSVRALCGSPGSVRVFQRIGPGNRWDVAGSLLLQAPEPALEDEFGSRIAMDGNVLVVSALERPDPSGGTNLAGGPVRVYRREGGSNVWNLEGTLIPDGGFRPDEEFGSAVAVVGDDVVVGSDDNGTSSPNTGVYLFHKTNDAWQQTNRIANPIAMVTGFGQSVAATQSTIVVGAAEGMDTGSAWVIERDASDSWGPPLVVSPVPGESISNGHVGRAVAIDGPTLLIGMPGIGKARVESRTDRGWTSFRWFQPPRERPYSSLGNAVAVAGTHLVVADEYDPLRALNGGTVFVQ
jgi:hypothetical protein